MKTFLSIIAFSLSFSSWSGTQAIKETSERKTFTLDVQFPSGSAKLGEEAHPHLDKLANFMEKYPDGKLEIKGFADSVGDAQMNQKLSEKRANAIQEYLVKEEGIPASRISAKGFGEIPIEDNDSPEGRALNRRVIAIVSL